MHQKKMKKIIIKKIVNELKRVGIFYPKIYLPLNLFNKLNNDHEFRKEIFDIAFKKVKLKTNSIWSMEFIANE